MWEPRGNWDRMESVTFFDPIHDIAEIQPFIGPVNIKYRDDVIMQHLRRRAGHADFRQVSKQLGQLVFRIAVPSIDRQCLQIIHGLQIDRRHLHIDQAGDPLRT